MFGALGFLFAPQVWHSGTMIWLAADLPDASQWQLDWHVAADLICFVVRGPAAEAAQVPGRGGEGP